MKWSNCIGSIGCWPGRSLRSLTPWASCLTAAGDEFTLESLVNMRMDQYADFIADMSVNASKELAIETAVINITNTWKELNLDMVEYKGAYKLRSTEDIYAALEDNIVTLSTMKASKFFLVFEKELTHWEKALSMVSETIEIILTVSAKRQ